MFASFQAHHATAAMELLGVIPHLNATCRVLRRVLTPPFYTDYHSGIAPVYCTPGRELLFLTFLYMLLGGLLPLALTYWHECSSKKAFLRRLQLTEDHRRFVESCLDFGPAMGPLGRVVCLWALLSICWSLLGIMISWAAFMRPVISALVASCSHMKLW
jgi:hypothetical protein